MTVLSGLWCVFTSLAMLWLCWDILADPPKSWRGTQSEIVTLFVFMVWSGVGLGLGLYLVWP